MTPESLRRLVQKHNAVQALIGILALVGTPPAWWFSFWLIRTLLTMGFWWLLGERTAMVTFWIAVGGLVILALEGLRKGWELFTLEDLAGRTNVRLLVPIGPGYYGNLNTWSFVLSQMLFFAPQITLTGINAFRTLLRPGPLTVQMAAKIYNDLEERHTWVLLDEYPGSQLATALLSRLRLVWTKGEEVPTHLRIPPTDTSATG